MFRAMLARMFARQVTAPIRNRRPTFRPCLHEMEDRTVPAFPVNLDCELGNSSDVQEDGIDLEQIFIWDTDGNSAPITVNFSISGTATEGTDYTVAGFNGGPGTYSVVLGGVYFNIGFHDDFGNGPTALTLVDDSVSEPDETIVLTLLPGTGYTVGPDNTYTFTIKDNEPNVVTVAKVNDTSEGSMTPGKFRFTRTGI